MSISKHLLKWVQPDKNTDYVMGDPKSNPKARASKKKEMELLERIVRKECSKPGKGQWYMKASEFFVKRALEIMGEKVWSPKTIKGFRPDLETKDTIYEVKSRSYSVPGTAGEKILGTPCKYSKVPKLYGKKLEIVLIGYQEEEAEKWEIFDEDGELKEELALWKRKKITYKRGTDFVKAIVEKGCIGDSDSDSDSASDSDSYSDSDSDSDSD